MHGLVTRFLIMTGLCFGLLGLLPTENLAEAANPSQLNDTLVSGGDVLNFQISPDNMRVVYVADEDTNGTFELFSVPLDGSTNPTKLNISLPTTLMSDGTFFSQLQVSPSNTRVVYNADQDTDNIPELFSVPLEGGPSPTKLNNTLPLGGDVSFQNFQISPDSTRVVFVADQDTDEVFELYSVLLTGGPLTKLNNFTFSESDVGNFQISPDSLRVVYTADQTTDEVFELYSVPITTASPTKLNSTLVSGGDVENFLISPDSLRVVYTADQTTDNVTELYSVPITTASPIKLNSTLVSGGNVSGNFQISPDSLRVVYTADQTTDNVTELYSVPITTASPIKLNSTLVSGGNVSGNFQISPDSSRVVYNADQLTDDIPEIFSVPLSGGATTPLNGTPLSGAFGFVLLHISPDNSRVLYLADQETVGVGELFSVPLNGPITSNVKLNLPLVLDGDVGGFSFFTQISPDSSRVIYLADREEHEVFELYSVPLNGPAISNIKLNDPLPTGGDVKGAGGFFSSTQGAPKISPDSSRVVFLADQDADNVLELFSIPLDSTAPLFQAATVTGASLVLTYDEDLNATPPVAATAAFTITRNAVADPAVTLVAIAGPTVTLALASPVLATDIVTVAYDPAQAGTTPLQDATGNQAVLLPAQLVTNNTADTTAPLFQAATVTGASLVLTYDEDLNATPPVAATAAFTITRNAVTDPAVTLVAIAGPTVTLTLASPVLATDIVTVAYDPAQADTTPLQDATGNQAVLLPAQLVTNNTANQAPDGVINTPSSPQTITVGDAVDFTGTGTDPDGHTPLTHLWNFDSGSGLLDSTQEDPGPLTFTNAGVFVVTYTVTDSLSLADPTPATVQITVQESSVPVITFPLPSSPLTSSLETFVWSTGTGVDEYWLGVGTSQAALANDPFGDIFSGSTGLTTSQVVSGIPITGSQVFVRLWYRTGATWLFTDYIYDTQGVAGVSIVESAGTTDVTEGTPGITDDYTVVLTNLPTDTVVVTVTSTDVVAGVTVDAATLTFGPGTWDTPQPVTVTAVDDALVEGTLTTAINHDIDTGLTLDPAYDGLAGTLSSITATITDNDSAGPPALTSPPLASPLTSSLETFVWSAGTGVDEYWLGVGTSQAALANDPFGDIFSGSTGLTTSQVVSGIPITGSQVFVRLWYRTGATWLFTDYIYDTQGVAGVSIVESAGTTDVTEGTPGITDDYTVVLTNLPTDTVVVTVTSTDVVAGVTVDAATLTFGPGTWDTPQPVTVTAVDDALVEGTLTTAINHDIDTGLTLDPAYDGLAGTLSSITATITDNDSAGPPALTSPPLASPLTSSLETFVWSAGTGVDEYWLGVGTSQAALANDPFGDIFSGSTGLTTSQVVSGIPITGSQVFVRLWYRTGATWLFTDYIYDTQGVAGVSIVESAGTTDVTEGTPGITDDYTVVLTNLPTDTVVVTVTSTDVVAGVTVDAATLTFGPGTWDTPQPVTVTAVDDALVEGTLTTAINHDIDTGLTLDPAYDGLAGTLNSVSATVTDNDSAGVSIVESAGTTDVTEGTPGITDDYTVVLTNLPTDTVVVTVTSTDVVAGVTVDAATLTFGLGTWDTPQPVTVTAVDDALVEGTLTTAINHDIDTGLTLDPAYDGLAGTLSSVSATVTDNDSAGVSIVESAGTTDVTEGTPGITDDYTVVLTNLPTDTVVVTVTSTDVVAGVTVDAATLTFGPGTWDTPQPVTVTAVDDALVEGTLTTAINHDIDTGLTLDPAYDGLAGTLSSITATITDNDSAGPPALTSPPLASPLTSSLETFVWSAGTGVDEYWLGVGTSQAALANDPFGDIFSGSTGLTTSQVVSGIPITGSQVFVRLWYRTGATWLFTDYIYDTSGGANQAPNGVINTPSSPQTITVGDAVDFTGTGTDPDGHTPLTHLWNFDSGSGLLDSTQEDPGPLTFTNAGVFVVTYTVTDSLSLADPTPATVQITVQESSVPVITFPLPSSPLTSSLETFVWSTGTGVDEYWLGVGTSQAALANDPFGDIFSGSTGLTTSQVVSGIPITGSQVFVRLWYRTGATWLFTDYIYDTSDP